MIFRVEWHLGMSVDFFQEPVVGGFKQIAGRVVIGGLIGLLDRGDDIVLMIYHHTHGCARFVKHDLPVHCCVECQTTRHQRIFHHFCRNTHGNALIGKILLLAAAST